MGLGEIEIGGQPRAAIDLYTESLALRQQIVQEFGRSPESLRDVLASISRFALLAFDADQQDKGCRELRRCQAILDEIEEWGWRAAQTVQDRQWLERQLAEHGCPAE